MRKNLLLIVGLLMAVCSFGQTISGDRVVSKQGVFIRDRWVDTVKNDTANISNAARSIMTAKSIYDFVNGRTLGGGGGSGPDSSNAVAVKNVSDLRSTNYHISASNKKNSNDRPYIKLAGWNNRGDGGGGDFYWDDSCTHADNGGTIFKRTGVATGGWHRLHDAKFVNVLWFGAKNDSTLASASLNRTAFNAAKNALQTTHFSAYLKSKGTIYFPGGVYFIDSTLTVDGSYIIRGDEGTSSYQSTRFYFSGNFVGMHVTASDPTGKIGGGTRLQHLGFFSYYQSTFDTTLHALKIRGTTEIEYCSFQNFPGDGIEIFCDAITPGNDEFGNGAFTKISQSRFHNNRNGIHVKGGDGNVILTEMNDFTSNRGWGYWNESFLITVSNHDAYHDNTYITNNKTQVVKGGVYYMAITFNTNYPPDSTGSEYYWYRIDGVPFNTYFTTWNRDTLYHGGGAYCSWPGLNAHNVVTGIYIEGGQLLMMGARTMMLNGVTAAAYIPDAYDDMRFEAAGAGYNFNTFFGYANDRRSHTRTQIGSSGLQFYPNANQTNNTYPYTFRYDTVAKKLVWEYVNASFPMMEVPSTLASPSDFGLAAIKTGVPSFPQGVFINRNNVANKRFFGLGNGAQPSSGEWATGDILLNASTSNSRIFAQRNTSGGSPGTWQNVFMPVDSIYIVDSNFYGYRQAGVQYLLYRGSAGGGSGTVNSGTQYQIGYYAANGTAISGNTGIGTNAANRLIVSSSDPEPVNFTTTSSSPLGGTYFPLARFTASNIANGNICQYLFGGPDGTNNKASLDFHYASSGNTGNYLGLGFYANSDLARLYATGNFVLGSTDIGVKFYNAGTSHFAGNVGIGTTTLTSLVNIGSSADFQVTSAGKIAKYNNSSITDGQLLIGHTSNGTFEKATLTQGSGITITNAAGAITVALTDHAQTTYTPTLTNTTNIAASTAFTTYYVRIGDWVHVWGEVDIDATAATTISEMGLSLPVATSINNSYALSGTASFEDNTSVQIHGDVANGRAMFRFTPQTATNNKYSFHFSYKWVAP